MTISNCASATSSADAIKRWSPFAGSACPLRAWHQGPALFTDLGEAPTWDARTGRLYFVDINMRAIHVWEAATGEHTTIEGPEMVGTIALTTDEDIILAALHRWAACACLMMDTARWCQQ